MRRVPLGKPVARRAERTAARDPSQGRDAGPLGDGTPPDLDPGERYLLTVDSTTVTLEFGPR